MKFKFREQRKRRVTRFGRLFPDIIKEFELEDSFTVEKLISDWESLVGSIIATHSKPDRIFKRTLFVAVDHSVYANEIGMMKDTILKKIESEYSPGLLVNLKVEIKKINWNK